MGIWKAIDDSDSLEHYGVLGMHWGVRRYQNADGSYKKGAEGRYNDKVGSGKTSSSISKIGKKLTGLGDVKGGAGGIQTKSSETNEEDFMNGETDESQEELIERNESKKVDNWNDVSDDGNCEQYVVVNGVPVFKAEDGTAFTLYKGKYIRDDSGDPQKVAYRYRAVKNGWLSTNNMVNKVRNVEGVVESAGRQAVMPVNEEAKTKRAQNIEDAIKRGDLTRNEAANKALNVSSMARGAARAAVADVKPANVAPNKGKKITSVKAKEVTNWKSVPQSPNPTVYIKRDGYKVYKTEDGDAMINSGGKWVHGSTPEEAVKKAKEKGLANNA